MKELEGVIMVHAHDGAGRVASLGLKGYSCDTYA